jgi:ABC-type transport auxiliary lipoprotein component
VLRFEARADGKSYLMARWAVRKGADGRTVVTARDASYAQDAASKSTTASVEALSATLADLGRDITASLGSLPQSGTGTPPERPANTRSTSPSKRP